LKFVLIIHLYFIIFSDPEQIGAITLNSKVICVGDDGAFIKKSNQKQTYRPKTAEQE